MNITCAWCRKILKRDYLDARITHGICRKCARKLEKEGGDLKNDSTHTKNG